MTVKRLDIVGSYLPILKSLDTDEERDDFRNVPTADHGNDGYDDTGMFGNYGGGHEKFIAPEDHRFFEGYGATRADLDRGYVACTPHEDPAYDLSNYKLRSNDPKPRGGTVEDFGNTDALPSDYEFRRRNNASRGFLTRPRIPTER